MDYYREVMTDDPFRRRERENQGECAEEDDKGDLFGLRQRARHLRVLIDRESLSEPSNDEQRLVHKMLDCLLTKYDPVLTLFIDMSRVKDTDDGTDCTPNVVHLRDYSEQKGSFSYPGPFYGYRICYERGRRTQKLDGNLSPGPQLMQNLVDFAGQGGPHLQEVSAEEVQRHVLLTQAGRAVADLVISESAVSKRNDIPANQDANVFSPSEAIPIVAHYLRTQQIYVVSPLWNERSNRKTFYHSAVYAIAPGVTYWEAKANYTVDRRYISDCQQMIGRLIRSLKAFDDLRFHLGALQTTDSYDDVADCVDRILWSLCGAVDVIARSLHVALKVTGPSRNAKFHGDWYQKRFQPTYGQAKGLVNVDRAQAGLSTVFKLRNTVHSHALSAAGASSTTPTGYVGKERGRVRLIVPPDVYRDIDQKDHARWGFEQTGPGDVLPATADLATVAATAIDTVFSFIDQLCWMLSFEGIEDRHEVLKLDVFTIAKDGRPVADIIRRLFGFPVIESYKLGNPYEQIG